MNILKKIHIQTFKKKEYPSINILELWVCEKRFADRSVPNLKSLKVHKSEKYRDILYILYSDHIYTGNCRVGKRKKVIIIWL